MKAITPEDQEWYTPQYLLQRVKERDIDENFA
jgi:hypothetical protein